MMKTIKWGMIGCGAVTEVKSGPGLYKAENSTLLAVCDQEPSRAQDYAKRHNVPKAYASSAELVADPEIDIIYIATPPCTHKELSELVAKAGKHVCVEKPMAMHHSECQEIIDICTQHKVNLYVAFYRRGMERFHQLKKWVEAGEIGQVLSVRAIQHLPPATEDLSPTTLPWRLVPEIAGGGKFLDMAVHTLDIFDFLFGPIEEVYGIANNLGGLYKVEDNVSAAWRHKNGVLGSGSWCYVCEYKKEEVEIIGSKGHIKFEFFTDNPLILVNEKGQTEVHIPNPAHVHQPFFQTIVNELNGGAPCPGDIESAVRSSLVADEILKNYRVKN